VSWETEALLALMVRLTLIYLAVAQFGRGRGEVDDALLEDAETEGNPWRAAVDAALSSRSKDLVGALKAVAGAASREEPGDAAAQRLGPVFEKLLRDVLVQRYPEAAGLLLAKR